MAKASELAEKIVSYGFACEAGPLFACTDWVKLAAMINVLEAQATPQAVKCKARSSCPDPQDCDWPFCECDPAAIKVLQAIEEGGFAITRAPTPPAEARELVERAARAFCSWTGVDPDLDSIVSTSPVMTMPAWQRYIGGIKAILAALPAAPEVR